MQWLYKRRAGHTLEQLWAAWTVFPLCLESNETPCSRLAPCSLIMLSPPLISLGSHPGQSRSLTVPHSHSKATSVYMPIRINDRGWQIWHGFLWPWPQGWLAQLLHLALTWGSLRVAWKWDLAGLVGLGGPHAAPCPRAGGGWDGGWTPTNTNMKAPLKNTDLVGAPSFHHKNRSK